MTLMGVIYFTHMCGGERENLCDVPRKCVQLIMDDGFDHRQCHQQAGWNVRTHGFGTVVVGGDKVASSGDQLAKKRSSCNNF